MINFVEPEYNKITLDTCIYFSISSEYSEDYTNFILGLSNKEPNILDYIKKIVKNKKLVSIETVAIEFSVNQVEYRLRYKLNKRALENIQGFIRHGVSKVYSLDNQYSNSLGADAKERSDNEISIVCETNGIGNLVTYNIKDFIVAFNRISMPKEYRLFSTNKNRTKLLLINWFRNNKKLSESKKLIELIKSIFS